MVRIPPATLFLSFLMLAVPGNAAPGYADLADLTLAAPVIVRATIARAERIADKDSPGLAPGHARLLISAAVDASLVAPGAIPATLQWLWDAPLDARGKVPKPKGQAILAWIAAPGPDGKTRLITRDAQQPWDTAIETRTRAIAVEARSGAVPIVTGVTNGFRADGTVPGESESQFFLSTRTGRGLTMVVTAKPGQARSVAVSTGDVIDESAAMVKAETLLQYRLACTLPAKLPAAAGGGDPALAADWQAALAAIGPCGRGS
ncbi:hypothetical protein [Sandarakinorhabdus sp. DWP1-3-1]|uniref:hypothetical protein n=1 Tax=Sandarakinorhabdus sp. DWP1-3-1 TaxID=2804627 RepID=UPI003CED1D69